MVFSVDRRVMKLDERKINKKGVLELQN